MIGIAVFYALGIWHRTSWRLFHAISYIAKFLNKKKCYHFEGERL
jgi:hypothetical protein